MRTRIVATAHGWVDIPEEQFSELLRQLRNRGHYEIAAGLIASGKIVSGKKQAAVDAIYSWSVETVGAGPSDEIWRFREQLIADLGVNVEGAS